MMERNSCARCGKEIFTKSVTIKNTKYHYVCLTEGEKVNQLLQEKLKNKHIQFNYVITALVTSVYSLFCLLLISILGIQFPTDPYHKLAWYGFMILPGYFIGRRIEYYFIKRKIKREIKE